MKGSPIIVCGLLLGALLALGQEEQAKPRNPEQMYRDALSTLDDVNTTTISGVLPLLEESAAQGHPGAVILLLDVYGGHRKGLDAQPAKAAGLAYQVASGELSLDARYPGAQEARQECMFRYALFCERGLGCPKNEQKAFRWMFKTAGEKVDKARVELARYAMMGTGTRKAPREAMKLLIEQARLRPDTPHLFFYLGYMYQKGLGIRRPDLKSAFKCYAYGERFDDDRAINNLAGMYEQGIGVSRDLNQALRLYKKAASLGNKDASANMQRLAYLKAEEDDVTPAMQKINRAAIKVIRAMPLSGTAHKKLSAPFLPPQENAGLRTQGKPGQPTS